MTSGIIALQVHSIRNEGLVGKTVSWRNMHILTEDLEQYRTPANNNKSD